MEYKIRQRRRHIMKIFKERPKLYTCPLPKKKQRTTMKAQKSGKVKIFTEEEVFLFRVKRLKLNTPFNY